MSSLPIIAWDQAYNRNGDGTLPRAAVNVIRTYMDNNTLTGWVKQETLMAQTGLSESQVRRQIKANVEAGWLEVVKLGRSGLATDYRLTYPQLVTDDRLESDASQPLTGHGCPVTTPGPNRSLMTGYTPQPVTDDRLQPVIDDTPTSPTTSPQEKLFRETDPFEGDRLMDETSNQKTTSDYQPVIDDRLGQLLAGAPLAPGPDWTHRVLRGRHAWMPPKGSDEDPL